LLGFGPAELTSTGVRKQGPVCRATSILEKIQLLMMETLQGVKPTQKTTSLKAVWDSAQL